MQTLQHLQLLLWAVQVQAEVLAQGREHDLQSRSPPWRSQAAAAALRMWEQQVWLRRCSLRNAASRLCQRRRHLSTCLLRSCRSCRRARRFRAGADAGRAGSEPGHGCHAG